MFMDTSFASSSSREMLSGWTEIPLTLSQRWMGPTRMTCLSAAISNRVSVG